MNILIISVIRKKKPRKNPCFQICLKNKKLLIWKPQRSVNFSISAEHLLVRPFQLFTCYRTFFSFTVSSFFFYKCCLWILSKSFPVVLQAIFFFWINFFQKVNSKLPYKFHQDELISNGYFLIKITFIFTSRINFLFHVYLQWTTFIWVPTLYHEPWILQIELEKKNKTSSTTIFGS